MFLIISGYYNHKHRSRHAGLEKCGPGKQHTRIRRVISKK